jgi:lipopolysaccharide/colanic/teichoic acid biosynthesis glycosyltransferase
MTARTEILLPSLDPCDIEGSAHGIAYLACKRTLDVFLSLVLVVALSPLLLLIAVLVKLTSPGPAIFRQRRVGSAPRLRNGHIYYSVREFTFYKFRTMLADADPAIHQAWVRQLAQGHPGCKLKNDSRVTGLGHFLRKTSLDELPQLINVVKGEMSFVGPRPVPQYEVALYTPRQFQRLAAKPGITGLWQVKGRGEVSFEETICMDVEYVRTASLATDLKLLCMTIPALLSAKGE